MNKLKGGICLLLLIIIGYIFAGPYLTVYQMKKAAENHDGGELAEHIEFTSLRQNLKDQLNAMIGKEMIEGVQDNPFSAIGATLGGMMVEKMINAFVTPSAITKLMEGKKPNQKASGSKAPDLDSSSSPFGSASMSYESLNKFSIATQHTDNKDEIKFILRRRGIGWKLTEINLPLSTFEDSQKALDKISKKATPGPEIDEFLKPVPVEPSINGKFLQNKKEGSIFVISGDIKNPSSSRISFIKVKGTLSTTAGLKAKDKTVFCGNIISDDLLKNGDIDTIDNQLMVAKGQNNSNVDIEPNETVPFMFVFSDLPEDLTNFTVAVETFER
jgi:hypothetical protein